MRRNLHLSCSVVIILGATAVSCKSKQSVFTGGNTTVSGPQAGSAEASGEGAGTSGGAENAGTAGGSSGGTAGTAGGTEPGAGAGAGVGAGTGTGAGAGPSDIFKDCAGGESGVFVAKLYELKPKTNTVNEMDKKTPLREICIKQLDIARRSFTQGFPGVEKLYEWFGLDIKTHIKIDVAGKYEFRIKSDDGSRVFIDGKEVINNDGEHSVREKAQSIDLTAGQHEIRVKYFQGPKEFIALELFWTPPGGKQSYIPLELLSRP